MLSEEENHKRKAYDHNVNQNHDIGFELNRGYDRKDSAERESGRHHRQDLCCPLGRQMNWNVLIESGAEVEVSVFQTCGTVQAYGHQKYEQIARLGRQLLPLDRLIFKSHLQ